MRIAEAIGVLASLSTLMYSGGRVAAWFLQERRRKRRQRRKEAQEQMRKRTEIERW